eukprot:CAMPEP_0171991052 /NCGR_PEP_ID=MMETSP0993-20121228/277235_1 /TAXON_ID=483369 /ORGANISM="non described non described, Strain CCMP2098" /LENGTH=216 /DNA_ID=CAMNT_0012644071 /DNA_START=588 /DNA_END=1238 /DNA_ORIENTATION=+
MSTIILPPLLRPVPEAPAPLLQQEGIGARMQSLRNQLCNTQRELTTHKNESRIAAERYENQRRDDGCRYAQDSQKITEQHNRQLEKLYRHIQVLQRKLGELENIQRDSAADVQGNSHRSSVELQEVKRYFAAQIAELKKSHKGTSKLLRKELTRQKLLREEDTAQHQLQREEDTAQHQLQREEDNARHQLQCEEDTARHQLLRKELTRLEEMFAKK